MNKQSHFVKGFVPALIITLGLLPAAAAFAKDGGDNGAMLPVTASVHVDAADNGGDSVTATTGVMVSGEDNTGRDNNGGSATSTLHRQDGEHRSVNSDNANRDSGNADMEIEIDHNSAADATTTIDAPEHVSNNGELRSFLNHVVKQDERIADVHVSSTSIETHYAMPAKFLWAIPTSLTADVSVASDGSVTVTYPWYAFLFATRGSDLAAQLQASTTGTATSFSASTQAHLLNALFAALKGSVNQ